MPGGERLGNLCCFRALPARQGLPAGIAQVQPVVASRRANAADPDVKLTFAKGAFLKDPARLFNSSLDGKVRRAIDIHEGEEVKASAFKALVRQAIVVNRAGTPKPAKKRKS